MDKLTMAHEYALKMLENLNPMQMEKPTRDGIVHQCFELAEAMQAEADKRVNKERPETLREVDWSVAPKNAFQWQMINNEAYWRIEIMGGLDTEPAPSFGFTGSHIVERPHGF